MSKPSVWDELNHVIRADQENPYEVLERAIARSKALERAVELARQCVGKPLAPNSFLLDEFHKALAALDEE